MGDAVPAFVHANGPAKVITYNFLLEKGAKVQSQLVTRRPVDRSGSEFHKTSTTWLTSLTSPGSDPGVCRHTRRKLLCSIFLHDQF